MTCHCGYHSGTINSAQSDFTMWQHCIVSRNNSGGCVVQRDAQAYRLPRPCALVALILGCWVLDA